jgi:glycosyltransferase involved in cell wall biosynthesis
MTEAPAITVLLPVLMRSRSEEKIRLLRDALESVADQRYEGQLRVLLIDDGSPEPIQALGPHLGAAANLVDWLRLDRNRGIVGALNAGIARAETPLLARLDADDTWCGGKIEAQVAQFVADPDLTISATGMERVDTAGNQIDVHVRPGDWTGILRFFVEGGCPFPHGSVLADRRVYQVLGGYPWSGAVRHCEDYALWGTWLRFFKPTMLEEPLYRYRVSDTSVSSEFADQQSAAAQLIRYRFERLELAEVLPRALPALAEALDSSLFEAGLLAYRAWRFGADFAVPDVAVAPMVALLPDRSLAGTERTVPWQRLVGRVDQETTGKLVALRADSLGETVG